MICSGGGDSVVKVVSDGRKVADGGFKVACVGSKVEDGGFKWPALVLLDL